VSTDTSGPDTAENDTATTDTASSETLLSDTLVSDSSAADTTPSDGADGSADSSEVADTAVAPLTPDKLTGLSLWLDAGKGITFCSDGVKVDLWADQSGNGNDAKNNGGCSATSIPAIVKSDIKGHDAVKFSGVRSAIIPDDPTLQFGTGSFSIIAVLTNVGGSSPAHVFWKSNSVGTAYFNVSLDANFHVTTPTASATAVFPSGYHVVVVRGPALEIRVDGVSTKGTTSTSDISYPGTVNGVWIGGALGSGDIEYNLAEMIAVKGTVTDEQVAGVEAYLKAKYKFTF
jgi:hypothetical protein